MKLVSALCVCGFALVASFSVLAQSAPPPGPPPAGEQGGHHRGPPPVAIEACSGKAVGASCSFVGRQGETLSGTCMQPPARPSEGGQSSSAPPVACRPQRK